ncbi:hypothetical protein B7463_g2408, partial [Scytalidium lignicola]
MAGTTSEWRQTEGNNIDDNNDSQNETSPLLGRGATQRSRSSASTVASTLWTWKTFLQRHVVSLCFIMIICLEIGTILQLAPLNRVLEGIICRDFYPEMAGASPLSLSDDPRCKSTEVQSNLAMLRGWQATLECLPGIITGVPYGLLSDRYGRKMVFNLSLSGIILTAMWYATVCWWSNIFPVWVTLTSTLFSFIGGGSTIFAATIYTVVADVVPDDESGALTDKHPWLAICLGIGMLVVGFCVAFIIPETIELSRSKKIHPDIILNDEGEGVETGINSHESSDNQTKTLRHIISSAVASLRGAAHFIAGNSQILLLLFTFLVSIFGRYIQELLLQYVTKRLQWSWSQAAYLMTLRSSSTLLLLVVILPSISHYFITHLSMTTRRKDLWLVRASSLFLVIGSFTIGLSGHPIPLTIGLIIFALGCGSTFLVRSLITSMVEPHYIGTLYNIMAICEATGLTSAGPTLSAAFRRGLRLGGTWIGLPFFISGSLFAIGGIIVWTLRVPDLPDENNNDNNEDEE